MEVGGIGLVHLQRGRGVCVGNMRARPRGVFVAATKQHVGKTTTSLALVAGAQRLLGSDPSGGSRVGFIKPGGFPFAKFG